MYRPRRARGGRALDHADRGRCRTTGRGSRGSASCARRCARGVGIVSRLGRETSPGRAPPRPPTGRRRCSPRTCSRRAAPRDRGCPAEGAYAVGVGPKNRHVSLAICSQCRLLMSVQTGRRRRGRSGRDQDGERQEQRGERASSAGDEQPQLRTCPISSVSLQGVRRFAVCEHRHDDGVKADELARFLADHAPFDALDEAALARRRRGGAGRPLPGRRADHRRLPRADERAVRRPRRPRAAVERQRRLGPARRPGRDARRPAASSASRRC